MMGQSLVSVIVPVYNVEGYLEACVDSIRGQTYKNLEIILVDDGSEDGSADLCDAFGGKDERIRVIHKRNGGLSEARNAGIEASSGDYLMFVDGDDVVSEGIVSYLLEILAVNHADMAVCDIQHGYPGEDLAFSADKQVAVYDRKEALCRMWYQEILMSACAKLYKRELFESLRFTKGLLYEDVDLMYKLVWKCGGIACGTAKLYGYMHREESITTKSFDERDLDILKICRDILDFAADKGESLRRAAKAYYVVGNLRVFLNAPNEEPFKAVRKKCKDQICLYGREVRKDGRIRKKLRWALIIFQYFRPVLSVVYRRVDRWR